jgi:hypothetical protein
MSEETKYTVFCDYELGETLFVSEPRFASTRPKDLDGLIQWASQFGGGRTPVAWAPDMPSGYGASHKCASKLRSESLSAGRTIEKVGERWVARGIGEEGFKIGAAYFLVGHISSNLPVFLQEFSPYSGTRCAPGHAFCVSPCGRRCHTEVRLSDGASIYGSHLLPGELQNINGEWVSVDERRLRDALAADAAEDLRHFDAATTTAIPFERPLSAREQAWKDAQAAKKAAAAEELAKRNAPKLAPAGLLILAPDSHRLGMAK